MEIEKGNIRKARCEALKHIGGPDSHIIIRLFMNAEKKTFFCQQCKREEELRFNPVFLSYDTNRIMCADCEDKIVKADKEQRIDEKLKALEVWGKNNSFVVDSMIETAGVPVILQSASMSDLDNSLSKALLPDQSYFIKGDVGVGKSHMAVAIMRRYIKNIKPEYDEQLKEYYIDYIEDRQPIFIEVPELLLRIRDTYNENSKESEKDIVDYYTMTPFLVLDDLGTEKASEFSTLMLYLIINRRCTSGTTTIITSNLNLEEIRDRLSDRISSRIKGMCQEVNVAGNDKRYEDTPSVRGVIDTIQDMT